MGTMSRITITFPIAYPVPQMADAAQLQECRPFIVGAFGWAVEVSATAFCQGCMVKCKTRRGEGWGVHKPVQAPMQLAVHDSLCCFDVPSHRCSGHMQPHDDSHAPSNDSNSSAAQ